MLKVLIIDDQPAVRTALETLFEVHDLPAVSVSSPDEALHLLATEDIGAVVQDMNFTQANTDGAEGSALFRRIRALDPDMPVLLMTAWTALEAAVTLIKEGAADYIAKPWDDDKLVRTVKNLVNLRALRQENIRLRAQGSRARRSLAEKHDLCGVIYASPQMHEVVRLAVSIAPSEVPVLITGPNGSGKEKLAEIIQANSRRRDKPFVRVNVGALPENLFEAELFGAEAGAFTGATRLRVGRFESADGGTLFLDELGTLPLVAQAKLLRVLQTGEYERLGSSTTRKANVRLVQRDQPGPAARDRRRAVSRGSVLSPQRHRDLRAAARRSHRRRAAAGRAFPGGLRRQGEQGRHAVRRRGQGGAAEPRLAGQRARAAEPRAARGARRGGRGRHRRRPGAGWRARAQRRAAAADAVDAAGDAGRGSCRAARRPRRRADRPPAAAARTIPSAPRSKRRWCARAASSPRPPPRWACRARRSTAAWSGWGSPWSGGPR